MRRRHNDDETRKADVAAAVRSNKAIAFGKMYAAAHEVGEWSEARQFFPMIDWSTVPAETERSISRKPSEMIAERVSEDMVKYRSSAEFLEVQEAMRLRWLEAGIDTRIFRSHIARLRKLVDIACPSSDQLFEETFFRDGFLFEPRHEWFPVLWDRACRVTAERRAISAKSVKSPVDSATENDGQRFAAGNASKSPVVSDALPQVPIIDQGSKTNPNQAAAAEKTAGRQEHPKQNSRSKRRGKRVTREDIETLVAAIFKSGDSRQMEFLLTASGKELANRIGCNVKTLYLTSWWKNDRKPQRERYLRDTTTSLRRNVGT